MIVSVLLTLFAIGSSVADHRSLINRVDDIVVNAGRVLRQGGDSAPLKNFVHPFAFDFYGRPFPGTLTGSNGVISNIHDLSRWSDVSVKKEGNQNRISVPIAFQKLKVSYSNYEFQYVNKIDVKGSVGFERAWTLATVEITAAQNGETCNVTVDKVSQQNYGVRMGKTKFTGGKFPEAFEDNVEDWILQEFPNTGEEFRQTVLNAFKQSIENSKVDLCKNVE